MECEIFRILLKHLSDHLSVLFQFAWLYLWAFHKYILQFWIYSVKLVKYDHQFCALSERLPSNIVEHHLNHDPRALVTLLIPRGLDASCTVYVKTWKDAILQEQRTLSEAATGEVLWKKVLLKISPNSQGDTCVRV